MSRDGPSGASEAPETGAAVAGPGNGGCRGRARLAFVALAVAILVFLFGPMLWPRPPRPDPTGVFPKLPALNVTLPVFDHPSRDGANAPIAVFLEQSQDSLELHVLFPDEDHPLAPIDRWYDLYRGAFRWKRIADLESFRMELAPDYAGQGEKRGQKPQPRRMTRLVFPGSHAGEQGYGPWLAKHHRRVVEVPKSAPRPLVIEIRTWNHLFALAGEPGPKSTMTRVQPPAYRATRAEVEAWLQSER